MNNFIQKYFGNFIWVLFSVFIIILPLIWADKTLLDASLISRQLALSIFLLIIGFFFVFLILKKKFTFYFNKTDRIIFGALLVYMLIHVVSSFGVINYQEAVFRSFKEFGFMLWVFFIYQLLRYHQQGREVLIKSVILMGSVFVAIGIYQITTADFTEFHKATSYQAYHLNQIMNNVYSTCSNKNLFAEILFLILPFAIYGVIIYRKFWRIYSVILVGLVLAFILILVTRSVFASLTISFVALTLVLVYYYFRVMPHEEQGMPEWVKISLIGIPVMAIVSGAILLKISNFQLVEALKNKIFVTINPQKYGYTMYDEDNPSSTRMRVIVWEKTLKMIKEHPVLGVGPGQWQIELPKFGLDEFEYNLRQGTLLFQRPHSDLLWICSEEGILGLICYLIFYIGAIVIGIRNFLNSTDKRIRIFNLLVAASLIGWLVDLSTNYPHERVEHNLMYLLLAAIVFSDVPKTEKRKSDKSEKSKINLIILVLLPLVIYNIYVTNQFYQGEKVARQIKVANLQKNWNKVVREAKKTEGTLYTIDNFTTPIYYYKGLALAALNRLDEAKIALEKAYQTNPYHLMTLNNYATSFDISGNSDMAIKYYNQALAISPRYKEPLVNLAIVYYNKKEFDKALKYVAQLPYDIAKNPEKYKQTYLTICRNIAFINRSKYDNNKLNEWIHSEDKVTATFLKYKNEGDEFQNILLLELKN